MYAFSYLQSAKKCLSQYDEGSPFSLWLKDFFRKEKKYGSRDRKHIAHLCYCYFRTGKAFSHLETDKKIIYSLFLCSSSGNPLLEGLDAELNSMAAMDPDDKIDLLTEKYEFKLQDVFPWKEELSNTIDHAALCRSLFVQPDLFLRIRPGHETSVKEKLIAAGLKFEDPGSGAIALANSSRVDDILKLDKEAVVQDLNSQKTLDALYPVFDPAQTLKAWDCCAASGGKSLLLTDRFPKTELSVSDIRAGIIKNLMMRFDRAGIKGYKSTVFDLAKSPFSTQSNFDLIICDAPCSGSGTWSRTPEQLYYFEKNKINYYSNLQKKIALNASRNLSRNGVFLYITCSVFKQENEEVVDHLLKETGMKLLSMEHHIGYDKKADSLFSAAFRL